jgi:hypothetical protein
LNSDTTEPTHGYTMPPPALRPVCTRYDAVSCALTPCVMLRISEYLSACFASSGSSSQICMPSRLVAIGLSNGPQ